jgi:translation initiation factor 1
MPEICVKCGLPKELCVCKVIDQETQKIEVSVEKRKFGKSITVISGITNNAKDLASQLKSKLACGGTFKNGHIELQGNHKVRVKDILLQLGYGEDQIEII